MMETRRSELCVGLDCGELCEHEKHRDGEALSMDDMCKTNAGGGYCVRTMDCDITTSSTTMPPITTPDPGPQCMDVDVELETNCPGVTTCISAAADGALPDSCGRVAEVVTNVSACFFAHDCCDWWDFAVREWKCEGGDALASCDFGVGAPECQLAPYEVACGKGLGDCVDRAVGAIPTCTELEAAVPDVSRCFQSFACCGEWDAAVAFWKMPGTLETVAVASCNFGAACTNAKTKKAAMSATIPLTEEEFDDDRQEAFKAGCASAAGIAADKVTITNISTVVLPSRRRNLLNTGIKVDVELEVPQETTTEELATSLSQDNLNKEMTKQGLPPVASVAAPVEVVAVQPTPPPQTAAPVILITTPLADSAPERGQSVMGPLVLSLLLCLCASWFTC